MQLRFVRAAVTLTLASLLASCQDATGIAAARRAAAGLYLLATVNGEAVPTNDPNAPTSGQIYLWPGGRAERRITYRASGGGDQDITMSGVFFVEGDTVRLELQTLPGNPYRWVVRAPLNNGRLTLGYPGPADGWVFEEYHRL